jgi:iron complex transport system substrate-binding protein
MKNKTIIILLILAIFLLTAACTAEQPAQPSNLPVDESILNYDNQDQAIALPLSNSRIISMAPSKTEILVALGLGDRIIAVDEHSDDFQREIGEHFGCSQPAVSKALAKLDYTCKKKE